MHSVPSRQRSRGPGSSRSRYREAARKPQPPGAIMSASPRAVGVLEGVWGVMRRASLGTDACRHRGLALQKRSSRGLSDGSRAM